MKKKWIAALAAMALATAAFAAKQKKPPKPKFPPYLEKFGSEVTGYKDDMPADLVIPEGVKTVGREAFTRCGILKSVVIPESVKEIGERAFYRCTNLKSLTIRNDIQRVGKEAFYGCPSLKKIEFGGTKAQWKASPISTQVNALSVRCSDGYIGLEDAPEYLVIDVRKNFVVVTGHTDAVPAKVVIPEGVTAIGQSAFQGCNALESVTIPNSVKTIGWQAFYGCTWLASVTIAEGVKTISNYAFEGCTSLANVTIPNSVTEIGRNAFKDCTSLASVTIPDSVTEIGDYAFKGCTSLKEVQFGGTKAQWKALKGSNGVKISFVRCSDGNIGVESVPEYLKMDGTVVAGYSGTVPANVVIPEGVTSIGNSAFRDCASLASVTIPNSVKTIERQAFYGCTSLASVTIAEGVTYIGEYVFSDCKSLKEIQFKGTKSQWKALKGSDDVKVSFIRCSDGNIGVLGVPDYLKMNDTVVTGYAGTVPADLVIPEGVTAIDKEAFKVCTSLKSVTIPGSVTEIGENALSGCSSLKEIQFSGTVAQWKTLKGSDGIKVPSVRCSDGHIGVENVPEYLKMYGTVVTGYAGTVPADLVIPEGVTAIDKEAFSDCTSLKSVTIPGSVTEIGEDAFRWCSSLKEIQFSGTVAQWKTLKGSDGIKVPSVRCSDGHIGVENVPEYLKMYGTVVTGYAGTLPAELVIPEGVTTIGGDSFYEGAFRSCTSLESVTIPGSVTEIGEYAFYGCSSLKKIEFGGTVAQWKALKGHISVPFVRCSDGHIGVESVPEYLKMGVTAVTGYAGTLPADLVIPDGVTGIADGVFKNCSDIESVAIPGSVENIGIIKGEYDNSDYVGAFSECTYLERVTIGDGVESIGERAFKDCTALKDVAIPGSVTVIGEYAFNGCASLASVTIAEGVKNIGRDAFKDCKSLKSVSIPKSVTEIGYSVFEGCTSLASVTIPEGVQKINGSAFKGCTSLKSVTIPGSVTEICGDSHYYGYGAFQDCTSLASVTIGEGVKTIGKAAFGGCTSLTSVTIPRSVTTIDYYAFYGCKSLKSVAIPRGVTTIEYNSFRNCTSLASVSIPRSVTSIGSNAFYNCSPNLKIQYDGTKAQWNAIKKDYSGIGKFIVQCSDGVITN